MNEQLRLLRKTLKMTQQDFVAAIGIKRGIIANYEIGRNESIDAVISLICGKFNLNEQWLRTGEAKMFIDTPQTILDQLCDQYGCDDLERTMILEYLKLNSSQRQLIKKYMQNIINSNNEFASSSITNLDSARNESEDYYIKF